MYEEERARKKIQETKRKTDMILKAKERKEKEMLDKLQFNQTMREEEMQNRERFTADRKRRTTQIEENKLKILIANRNASTEVKGTSKQHQLEVLRFKEEIQEQKARERKLAQETRMQIVERMRKAQEEKIQSAKTNYELKKKIVIDKTVESDGKAANLAKIEEELILKIKNTFDEQEREVQRLESLFATPAPPKKQQLRSTHQGSFPASPRKNEEIKTVEESPELRPHETIESKDIQQKEESQPVEMPPAPVEETAPVQEFARE